jgi:hypothetical protein
MDTTQRHCRMKRPKAQQVAIVLILLMACVALLVEWAQFLGSVP